MKKTIVWMLVFALLVSFAPQLTREVRAEGSAHSHSAAQHNCECGTVGCTETGHSKVTYEPWNSTTTLPSSGNYYLTADVNLADETSVTADMHLCLNGYTVTAATGKQIITTPKNNNLTLVISDCTAHTDALGNYTAGKLTGGVDKGKGRGGGAIQIRDGGNLKLYDGIITGNTSDTSGGAIRLGTGATFVMYDGEISNNSAISGTTTRTGGAISMVAGGSMEILGGTIKDNKGSDGGAIYTQSNATIKNCTLTGNTAGRGGAVYISGGATLEMENCTIRENRMNAEGAGAVYVTASKATLTGCTITGNRGINAETNGASAVYSAANSTVTLHDCTITGNTMAGTATAFRGTVYTANATEKLILSGKTVISGNLVAVDGTAVEQNVYLRSTPNTPVDIGGLTAGAMLSIRTHGNAVAASPSFVKYTAAPANWYSGYVRYENNGMAIDYSAADGFHFASFTAHSHCECGDGTCTQAAHKKVEFLPWNEKTTLPTSGNYYLNTDVELAAETSISADLNLCLHGHTVKAAEDKRHLSTPNNLAATVCICDCTATTEAGVYKAGSFTGGLDKGNGQGGGSIYIRTGGTLKLYDGVFADNTSITSGGAIAMNAGTTFRMAGGQIIGNKAIDGTALKNGGGLILRNGCDAQITGGTIANNTGDNGGGICLETDNASIRDCCILGNTAQTGAAIFVAKDKTATVTDCQISGNKATGAGGAAIYLNSATITLDGCTMTGNRITEAASTGASVIYSPTSSSITLKDCTITDNEIAGTDTGFRGAVYTAGATEVLILSGDVVIKDNFTAVDGAKVERNIYLQRKPSRPIDVGGLTAASSLTIFTHWGTEATPTMVKADVAPSAWTRGWVIYDNNQMAVDHTPADGFFFSINAEHIHCQCGAADCTDSTHEQKGYMAWNDTAALPTAGSYFLNVDVNLAGETSLTGDLDLCLHGHTVTAAAGKQIITTPNNTDLTLTITDCTACYDNGVYKAGKLTGGTELAASGRGGGAIYIRAEGNMVLYDGIITGNTSGTAGGAIRLGKNATLVMHGGELSHNQAVSNNTMTPGGAISAITGTQVTILGGRITDNAGSNGGAIHTEGALTICDGVLTGNAGICGGAVYISAGGALELRGGSLTGNSASEKGGGVYTKAGGKLSVSGATTVTDNSQNGAADNLYLDGENVITVGALAETAKLGIGAKTPFRAISQVLDTDLSARFFSDSGNYVVVYKDSALYLGASGQHSHCLCADRASKLCEHTAVAFAPWEDPTSLPVSGYYYLTTDVQMTEECTVTADLYLCLHGHTVTAAQGKRHISTPANTALSVVICDCTAKTENGSYTAGKLTGGVDQGNGQGGGSLYIRTGGKLKLFDGILTGNTSITGGGAVRINKDAYFYLYDGQISDNTAIYDGKLQIGGGICGIAGSSVTILGGSIRNNKGSNGGGIFSQGELTVSGGTVQKNTATNGGGIYTLRNQVRLSGGLVSDNVADYGGGLLAKGCTVELSGIRINDNRAKNTGGGIRMASDVQGDTINIKKLTMTAGSVSNNSANEAGGILLEGNGTQMHLLGGEICGNRATVTGGGVYAANKTSFTMEGGRISGNKAKHAAGVRALRATAILSGGKITDNAASGAGGGIYASYDIASIRLQGTQITGNTAQKGAGAMVESGAKMTMSSGLISNNTSTVDGGGGILVSTDCSLEMTGGTITGNAAKFGGGIYGFRTSLELSGGTISKNSTRTGGGGIQAVGCKVTIRGLALTGNTVEQGNGGGIRAVGATTVKDGQKTIYPTIVDMHSGTISENRSLHGGGGSVEVQGSVWNMYGGTICNNVAESNGGGLYATTYTETHIQGGEFYNNAAQDNGGAFYHYRTVSTYENCIIRDNTASVSGGGLFTSSRCHMTFTNVVGQNNTAAVRGGAMFIEMDTPATFTGCTFTKNKAMIGGGVFGNSGATITMTGCTFTDNTASDCGGGLAALDIARLTDCVFTGNTANRGGGLYTGDESQRIACNGWGNYGPDVLGLKMDGCRFTDNEATQDGGAIYMFMSCYGYLRNSTITGNTAGNSGSAIWCAENLDMADLIITGNTCKENGSAVFLAAAEFDGLSYFRGLMKISGDLVIADNQGGDLYLDTETTLNISSEGLGEDAKLGITLDSGLLTQRLFGSYDYEGGDCVYLVTCGDRSLTAPEYDPDMVIVPQDKPDTQQTGQGGSDAFLYIGIAAVALVLIAVAVLLVIKKKRSAAGETK